MMAIHLSGFNERNIKISSRKSTVWKKFRSAALSNESRLMLIWFQVCAIVEMSEMAMNLAQAATNVAKMPP
jgi:hypothetical protein